MRFWYLIGAVAIALLQVLCGALVSRVIFAEPEIGQDITATGVEFIHNDITHTVHSRKEVILSAGFVLRSYFSIQITKADSHNSALSRILKFWSSRELVEKISLQISGWMSKFIFPVWVRISKSTPSLSSPMN
jgi:hypothetical protein